MKQKRSKVCVCEREGENAWKTDKKLSKLLCYYPLFATDFWKSHFETYLKRKHLKTSKQAKYLKSKLLGNKLRSTFYVNFSTNTGRNLIGFSLYVSLPLCYILSFFSLISLTLFYISHFSFLTSSVSSYVPFHLSLSLWI